ncbi:MAG: type II toxin-antitoxin system PemK/MazF family toxin [Bacteroidales bacterium]|nr:type II toxin-antitoxin system PemK/MazF family toxin [Bacteroidales bacterium]
MKKRGEVWWINFDPSIGEEITKKRPAVIVSNNISNKHLKRYQVVPLSSRVDKLYPTETKIRFGKISGKAMADQLTTVSELRFIEKAGEISDIEMKSVDYIIKLQLNLQ